MPDLKPPGQPDDAAYREGWRAGLALGALTIAGTAFINLLSLEKSLLAIVLAILAIRGAGPGRTTKRGSLAVCIAVAHLALGSILLILFHDKLAQLLSLLQSLG